MIWSLRTFFSKSRTLLTAGKSTVLIPTVLRAPWLRSLTLARLATRGRLYTRTYSLDSIAHLRFCLDYRKCKLLQLATCFILTSLGTQRQSTCGLWVASLWSFSWVYPCFQDHQSTIRYQGSLRCLGSLQLGCWKWASSRTSFLKRHKTSLVERATGWRAWSNMHESIIRKSSPAKSISPRQHWRTSSRLIHYHERTWSQWRSIEVCPNCHSTLLFAANLCRNCEP